MNPEAGIRTFNIEDPSAAGEARRAAVNLAASLGFSERRSGELAIVVSEAAKNVAAHAGRGELLLRALHTPQAVGIEVLAIDDGPGMADIALCRRDGYSTAGTTGIGLGALERLATRFDVHSVPGKGTVVRCTVWDGKPDSRGTWDVGLVTVPKPGETACGDGWAVHDTPQRAIAMVADGLGHGPAAREASAEAERLFREESNRPATEILELMHGALRSTRGASIALAECDRETSTLRVVGVGNISVSVIANGETRSAISHNGTVGHNLRKIQAFTYPFPSGSLLVMHSDGLSTQTRADAYPGLLLRPPALIAGVLYRDFRRGRDDATILIARDAEPDASDGSGS